MEKKKIPIMESKHAGYLPYLDNIAGIMDMLPASLRRACIKFPAVSDESDPACDDAYIRERVHPRYRLSRLESSSYLQTARLRTAGTWMKGGYDDPLRFSGDRRWDGRIIIPCDRSLSWGSCSVPFWSAHRRPFPTAEMLM